MKGEENLIPLNERTKEEQREIARQGGIASGEARRRKRSIKESLDILLSQPFKLKDKNGKDLKKKLEALGIEADDIDNQMAMSYSMFMVAMGGGKNSVSAFNSIRDTLGEKPIDKVEVTKPIDETTKEVDDYLCKKKN